MLLELDHSFMNQRRTRPKSIQTFCGPAHGLLRALRSSSFDFRSSRALSAFDTINNIRHVQDTTGLQLLPWSEERLTKT